MSIEVTKAYASQYPDPICFEVNATIQFDREDPEFPGWFWCRLPSGKEGWVHRSFLAASLGTTMAIRAYSAKELTAAAGERGTLLHLLDGWAFVRLESGGEGWIPEDHLQATSSELRDA